MGSLGLVTFHVEDKPVDAGDACPLENLREGHACHGWQGGVVGKVLRREDGRSASSGVGAKQ